MYNVTPEELLCTLSLAQVAEVIAARDTAPPGLQSDEPARDESEIPTVRPTGEPRRPASISTTR